MEKSADAFRTISEVADDLTLPQHVLRFWETRFPQIRPLKRAGGRRYYRPADVVLLKTIRQLLYDDGYTIKGVQRLLKEQGAKGLTAVTAADLALLAEDDEPVVAHDEETDEPPQHVFSVLADQVLDPAADVAAPQATGVCAKSREMIVDALETIDECLRILDGARRSS